MARNDDLTCPTCGAGLVPIAYGMPGPAMFEAADRGEIRLGGCTITFNDPEFECTGQDPHHCRRDEDGALVAYDG